MSSNRLDFFPQTEIPDFLSDEECEHIISLAKERGLTKSIAGFDLAAYEGDLDEDMKEAGKNHIFFGADKRPFSCFHREAIYFKRCTSELILVYFSSYYTFLLNEDIY